MKLEGIPGKAEITDIGRVAVLQMTDLSVDPLDMLMVSKQRQ